MISMISIALMSPNAWKDSLGVLGLCPLPLLLHKGTKTRWGATDLLQSPGRSQENILTVYIGIKQRRWNFALNKLGQMLLFLSDETA